MIRLRSLSQKSVAKNTSVLLVAQVISRALGLFYIAALARYVGTIGMGQISTANSMNGIFVLIVGPGLSTLLIRDVAANRREAGRYLSNSLFIKALLSVFFVLIIVVAAQAYPANVRQIICIYTVIYVFDSLGEIPVGIFRAFENMSYEAVSQIVRDLINVSLSLLAIYLKWSLPVIALISLVAQVTKFSLMMLFVHYRFVRSWTRVQFDASRQLLARSLPFGNLIILTTFQTLMGAFIISIFYGSEEVGIYSAANTILVTLLLIPQAFSSAIYPIFSRLHMQDRRQLRDFYRLAYKYLLILGFPMGLGLLLIADQLVTLIYGVEFAQAAPVLRVLALFLFTLVGYSNGPILTATGRQRFFMWTQAGAVGVNLILCFTFVPIWGSQGAAFAFVIAGFLTFLVHSAACHRQLELGIPGLTFGRVAIASALMSLGVAVALRLNISWLIVVFLIAPPIYILMLVALKLVKREDLRYL